MSNLVKEKITTNLDRAKSQGKIRAEHIREIVKDAVSQTVAELKEGSDEIGLIVKDAISTVIGDLKADLKGGGKEKSEKITASIEGAIAGSTQQRQQAIAERRERLLAIQIQLDQQQEQLDRESSAIMMDIKTVELPDTDSEEIHLAVNTYQEHHELGILQEQYLKLKSQLTNLDEKLADRYGDRYQEIKQQWEKAKTWYDHKKVEAEASGVIPLQQKQTEIENNLGELGSVVARKEEQIKQSLKEMWKGKDSVSKR
ncbi:histidine kinase [Pseudanabaena sp. FACHB-1998]|uniref:histidine kinase n=1 Tax=Pseudanabaena sp. FACHB-1998 TaxID=2692858 RepID=UPI0016804846|nr:histidine kinase [Pseudanabaena sp. FACHB-1998]MBD2178633.1 histidine kinase [Pseudanabaena sp. FACHB-1998]